MPTIAFNRQARYKYEILDKLEAGIKLSGAEVKSIRAGRISLREAYIRIRNDEAFLVNAHISPYQAQKTNPDPLRPRKLLLHKGEINRLRGQLASKNLTIIPLRVYTHGQFIKVAIGLARGKRKFEKRQKIRKQEAEQEIRHTLKKSS